MKDWIRYEVSAGIGWIVLNRPDKRNAVTAGMRQALYAAYQDVKLNPEVRVAVITGTGSVFCSGEDLTDPDTRGNSGITSDELDRFQQTVYTPVIAAVNGPAYGQGTRFVFTSDIVLMAEGASLVWPQVKVGLSSVSGPTVLAQRIPWAQAMGYLLRGTPIPAEECVRLGLANEVVRSADLKSAAERWAGELMQGAPLALRGIKEAALRGESLPIEARKQIADDIFNRVHLTEDAQEGIRAFKERRRPVWKGR
jgi:enoyl-CoA hydratase/carnithine racemase